METMTFNPFKKAARLLSDRLLHSGSVLDVRHWAGAEMTEIDLHLPEADMLQWQDVPYIKFRVGPFAYRDYTPFGWDADTSTCSLLVDTGHKGAGSDWAKQLKVQDRVQYVKVDFTRQSPHPTDLVVGLGDSSSLAHLLALRQLTLPQSRFDAAVIFNNPAQAELLQDYFGVKFANFNNLQQFAIWLAEQPYCQQHSRFYITGGNSLVTGLRQELRGRGFGQIRVKGFWN
ncbi:hypothetical protein EOD41_10095 [Mucilaginibacter limnophilus]|uniref:Siderophore-interacting protein n=1 Tax=Mucilaginibacter limnophilus TaxID=1932778 RepID=A0A3S2Y107_9SPHI|nr:hypothetical protein [Mucilaginibacter limnophilus]RVU00972.1 hypothetical protein EOD41_10095 [Mucilaginibacter limnophilus]